MHFIEKFDGGNIDGQHLRPPVLAILHRVWPHASALKFGHFDNNVQVLTRKNPAN